MTPWVLRLIVANVAMYFISQFSPALASQLVLVPADILRQPWTPVTYLFLHAGGMHLLFNMFSLYIFGPRVESRLGGGHFLGLYFVSGIGGALLSIITPYAQIVGASGAIFGVMLAYAMYWPRDKLLIYGVLPVEARWLVIIMTGISLWSGFTGASGGIAHFAHLGGFLGAFFYIKWKDIRSPARDFHKRAVEAPRAPLSTSSADLKRWARIPRESMHEVNRTEVDRLLDKINRDGLSSLTPVERETLERFSPRA
ncbi:MAG: rhomboid family intramembrane serine protease [Gemmatimonadota bacterium]